MDSNSESPFLFFGLEPQDSLAELSPIGAEWSVELFEPRLQVLFSQQLLSKFAIACWAMDRLRLFPHRDCRVLTIRRDGQLVHSSWAHPAFYRYPFMGENDVQIARVWTHPDFRGHKLARYGVHSLLQHLQKPDRTVWYVVAKTNEASIRVAETIGLRVLGEGELRRSAWGRQADQYVITKASQAHIKSMAA